MRCPACFKLMTRVDQDCLHWATCANCFGTLIRRMALLRIVRQAAADAGNRTPDAIAADQQEIVQLAATVVESDTRKAVRCSDCNHDMKKERLHPMIPINIDHCLQCDNIWLDVGEFSLLKKLYVELQTSTDPEIVQRREKLATVLAQWESRDTQQSQQGDFHIGTGIDILSHVLGQF